jgi:two-component system, OmpR family, phosphate regulon sensor histidine kinase PhoR
LLPLGISDALLLAGLLLLGLILGAIADHTLYGLLLGSLAYVVLSHARLRVLHRWLSKFPVAGVPPVHAGVLGDVGDRVRYLQNRLQKQLEETSDTLRRVRDSYAALKDGVVMLGPDNTIEWCNVAATQLLRLRYPDDVGRPLVNLVRDPEFGSYLAKAEFEPSFEMAAPGQSDRTLEVQATVFGEDRKVLFVRDVTALKRLETMRQDFLANISHEMRTPLTVIAGYLDSIGELLPERNAVLDKVIGEMHLQAKRMENLLRDLMLLSQLESEEHAERARDDAIAIEPLLRSVRDNALAACSGERRIDLRCSPHAVFLGDRVALESIVANLVFNAVKYTAAGGHIRIEFESAADGAVFSVQDDGIGIDPVHIPRLTERFYRVDKSRSLERGGTGLGLAIVKHALKCLDGQLQIESRPGAGSTFSCRFPAARIATDVAGRGNGNGAQREAADIV